MIINNLDNWSAINCPRIFAIRSGTWKRVYIVPGHSSTLLEESVFHACKRPGVGRSGAGPLWRGDCCCCCCCKSPLSNRGTYVDGS